MDIEWWKLVLPLVVSILLALVGYAAKYLNDLSIARRKDRLDRVNHQLTDLYGPLLALTSASNAAWETFRSMHRPTGGFWSDSPPPTPQEAAAWRLWMTEVFAPLNIRMVDIVLAHADLLEGEDMPPCLLELAAHVFAYKPVLKNWEQQDFSEHRTPLNFPREALMAYVTASFAHTKREQSYLLGRLGL